MLSPTLTTVADPLPSDWVSATRQNRSPHFGRYKPRCEITAVVTLFLVLAHGLVAGEPAAAPSFLTRGPYLQNGTPTSLVVCWRTSIPLESEVRFGLNPNALNLQVLNEEMATEHEVTLSELLPDTKYYYSIGTSVETLASGDDYFFITMPASGKPTRIWVIGDSGTASADAKAVYDRYREFTGIPTCG